MNTLRLSSAVLGIVAAFALRAADAPKPAPRTEVAFDNPENYADGNLTYGPDWCRDDCFSTIRGYLVKLADHVLPDGYSLKITFTDMDLGNRDSRHVRADSGVPASEFTYAVTDSSGTVVRRGTENLMHCWDFGNRLPGIDTADTAAIELRSEKAC